MTKENIELNWYKVEEKTPPTLVALFVKVHDFDLDKDGITCGYCIETEEGIHFAFSIVEKEKGGLINANNGFGFGVGLYDSDNENPSWKVTEWAELPGNGWYAL